MAHVVLITGAASGLGLSLTDRFLALGDTVYGITKTKRHWKEAMKKLDGNRRLHLIQADLGVEFLVRKVISRVQKEAGRIDILINNAGYANRPTAFEKESLQELKKNLAANLVSTFLVCKYALPVFKRQKAGWIINIASLAGKRAVPFLAAYSASKSGVLALSQALAKENPDSGFRCITVCPGGINTKMRAKLFGKKDAGRQQSADFVADKILEIVREEIAVPSGGDIVIRHGKVASINEAPAA